MNKTKKKVGLALGGGAARGIAHIGVLEVLQKANIPIDMVAGTSAGAVVGALLAQGKDTGELKKIIHAWDWKQRAMSIDLALPYSGFIAGRKIKNILRNVIGDITFEELKIPFACVATDIMTGEEVVLNQGSVLEAVRASISVPIIFSVVTIQGRYLVDGGLVNPVPVSVLKDMGADFIIAVNVTPAMYRLARTEQAPTKKQPKKSKSGEPNILSVITRMFAITNAQIVQNSLAGADIVIEPRMPGIGLADFSRADECILEGQFSAIDAVLRIKRHLGIT